MELNETLSNVIENVACHVAEKRAGRISPNHILPYLPVSLELVCDALNAMADGVAVIAETNNDIREYVFTAYTDCAPERGDVLSSNCLACDAGPEDSEGLLCISCHETFQKELMFLSEKTGWPAQAVYEHEILYLASRRTGPVHAEMLAGASRYTLRRMRKKLALMADSHFLRREPGARPGAYTYVFPPLNYSRARYRENREIIRSYPASLMEDVELKIVRILFALGAVFIAMLVLAFWGFPFPVLLVCFAVVAPVISVWIWRRKEQIEEE